MRSVAHVPSVIVLGMLALSCAADRPEQPPRPGLGVIYSFPGPGQLDVPIASSITVVFSAPVLPENLAGTCTMDGAGAVTGSFCVYDGEGREIEGRTTVVGIAESAVEFVPEDPLEPGQEFSVHVAPELLEGGAVNVPGDAPLFRFTTRRHGIVFGQSASVEAINGEPAAVFSPDSELEPRFPVVDFSTLHILFDEPLDPASVIASDTVSLVRLDALTGAELGVSGQVLVRGQHLTFDPNDDLIPGQTYRLRFSDALRDEGGEPVMAETFELVPVDSRGTGQLYKQVLDVSPGAGEEGSPAGSSLSRMALNTVFLSSPLLGDNTIEVNDNALEAEMAHPDRFTTIVPLVVRKGQRVTARGIEVKLGGEVPSGLETGEVEMIFISDVTGYLVRNLYWPEEQIPDNEQAPLHVFLTLDVAMTARDETGNAALSQTLLGIQASGLAVVQDGELRITNLGTLELDILGVAKAPGTMTLGFSTSLDKSAPVDADPPELVGSTPAEGGLMWTAADSILLRFSEPVLAATPGAVRLQESGGNPLPIHVHSDGSMLVVTPLQPLAPTAAYRILVDSGLHDLSKNPLAAAAEVNFSTPARSSAAPAPPLIATSYPGAPCATVDSHFLSGGQCVGGEAGDGTYLAQVLPANRDIEVIFDQPMDLSTMSLGPICGAGPIRVEEADADGSCVAAVQGTLRKRQRGFAFTPASPWQLGSRYRLVLNGGSNATCDGSELCGANGLPLNTDPLNGARADDAGGPLAVTFFTGVAADDQPTVITTALPIVDGNGNGKVDAIETAGSVNSAAVSIAGVDGSVISSATIDQPDCSDTAGTQGCIYLSSDLLVSLEKTQFNCQVPIGTETEPHESCVPVIVAPAIIYGTELNLDAAIFGISLGLTQDLKTGKVILRVRQQAGPIKGFIVEGSDGRPEMVVTLNTYMDAPDLSIPLAGHDLVSKPLTVLLRGPIDFLDDGRLRLRLSNVDRVNVEVGISVLDVIDLGSMNLEIAPGDMTVDLMSQAPRGGER